VEVLTLLVVNGTLVVPVMRLVEVEVPVENLVETEVLRIVETTVESLVETVVERTVAVVVFGIRDVAVVVLVLVPVE